jgi:hypothetical protein
MNTIPTDADLLAYADELLAADEAAAIEEQLREASGMRQRLALLIRQRDQGGHSLGEVWRRQRLSCPTRSELGSYVLGALAADAADYIEFHLHSIGCSLCAANLADLQERQAADAGGTDQKRETRTRRYFESSAGRLSSE